MLMRKTLLSIFLFFPLLSSSAQFVDDGFYRVMNYATKRYIYVMDNTGSVNMSAMTAEMGAVQLWKGYEKTVSDPASIIYIKKYSERQFDLISQGVSVHSMIGYYVQVYEKSDKTYQVYAEGLYLDDDTFNDEEDRGYLGTKRKGDARLWNVFKVDTNDNYFGIQPTVIAEGRKFKPFFADFAFSFADSGMKVWTVDSIACGAVVVSEFNSDIIADNTPVIIECTNDNASSNKLNLYKSTGKKPVANLLNGVYFNNPSRLNVSKDCCTEYNPATMRVLGVMSNGKLGYVKSDQEYLDANESYLIVPEGSADEMPVLTAGEYKMYKQQLDVERQVLYERLSQEYNNALINLSNLDLFINSECSDVASRFTDAINTISMTLDEFSSTLDKSYANYTLAQDYNDFVDELDQMARLIFDIREQAIEAEEEFIRSSVKSAAFDKNDVIFDLIGHRIDKITRPGVYIVNGKKVLISKP